MNGPPSKITAFYAAILIGEKQEIELKVLSFYALFAFRNNPVLT